jgi:fatty-acyl-CoA synthase
VMAGLVIADHSQFEPHAFAKWLDEQDAIGPKWRPRYVRVLRDPPTTGTNKIVKRALAQQKFRHDLVNGDELYVRDRGEAEYKPFTGDDERALYDSFVAYQRDRFWDL